MNFTDLLSKHAAERPDAIALYDVDHAVSYRALHEEANRLAALLHEQGARSGDRLALWLPNSFAWLAIFLACARLGITVVAMNTRFRSREAGDLISRGRCRWLAMWPSFKGLPFTQILRDIDSSLLSGIEGVLVVGDAPTEPPIPAARMLGYDNMPTAPLPASLQMPAGTAHALVYTTSGTTSQSKLVVHDQQTMITHGHAVARFHGIKTDDAILMGAPFCGAFGFSAALAGLASGAALISSPVLDPAECARQIRQYRATHTFANNELLDRILDAAGDQENPFPSLRIAGFASFAPSLGDLPQRAEKAGISLVGLYGSSELQALVAAQKADAPLSVREQPGGELASPEARVRARDTESGKILPHGEIGEIEILSPSLMKGYLDNEAATQKAVDAEGYFRTGDLGHTVDSHSFVFHARKGDFLRLSGFLVNPIEIEQFIEALDGITACQVVGVAHQGKTVPVAFALADEGSRITEQDVIAHCRASLAHFKIPVRAAIIEAFPVVESANSNKIQRGKLQDMALALLDSAATSKASAARR
ncbi:acyl-CoA synthetase [Allopusillimonas soli]|uniref:AMP-binding protein n=1 Tax=Allopusillimonas soli TaxID=659016 RepID=A0A853FC00_9BURK|nr:AMP-binding protein [Allopusillimonas soli]NYT36410.1 AMP-binding protein [Allopusillimonas soli]TEA74922.1 acyl-CoA synthetase [Allopusillimonas soli]